MRSAAPSRVMTAPRKFLAVFACCSLAGFALLFSPPVELAVLKVSRALVDISGSLISLCGGRATVEGAVLRSPVDGFAIEMKNGCNGINATLLLCSAVVAFPASGRNKMWGLLIGVLAIQSINVIRFISLFYLGQYSQTWFDFAHNYLWESLIMLDALVVFGLWANTALRPKGPAHVGH
jgi:exosortase H (IPTLxxWG-CTERM-specific)